MDVVLDIGYIKRQWAKDSEVNRVKILDEILRTPKLHSKYLDMLVELRESHREIEIKVIALTRLKSRYYRGEFSKEELLEHGWDQYQGVKPIKFELENLINTDPDMILLTTKLNECRICLDALESIIKVISSRSYDLKTFIEAEKFYNGK